MNKQIIYKSEEGKQQLLQFYKNVLADVDYDYNEIYIDTSFGRTYLFEAGSPEKTPVFLFHGSCSNSAMWYGDIKVLYENYHVLSVDILGEPGNSDARRLDLKSNDHALWINEILEKLNISKAIFIGNSIGAWMIQKFAINFPDKAEKLVLIAPSGIVNIKTSFLFKTIIYVIQGETGRNKLGKLIYVEDEIPDIVITFNKLINDNFNPIMGSIPAFSDTELSRLSMPTLFMCGENDAIVDAKKASQKLKSTLRQPHINIINDNGHVIFDTMKEIIPFLDGK